MGMNHSISDHSQAHSNALPGEWLASGRDSRVHKYKPDAAFYGPITPEIWT
jgi:hypothetical protein